MPKRKFSVIKGKDSDVQVSVENVLSAMTDYLGELTPERRQFFTKIAEESPDEAKGFVTAIKQGREADPKYAKGLQASNPNFSQRRVLRKAISDGEQDPSFEDAVRKIEDDTSSRNL